MENDTKEKEELVQEENQIETIQNELNTIKEKLSKKSSILGKIVLFFFLIVIASIEAGMVYFRDTIYNESIHLGIDISWAILAIMVTVFIYFFTLFGEGKFTSFLRNSVVFILAMISVTVLAVLKIEIDKIELPESATVEYVNKQVLSYENRITNLEAQNNELKQSLQKYTDELIYELSINRKALIAQQKVIKENSREVESGKKYQLIKNPF